MTPPERQPDENPYQSPQGEAEPLPPPGSRPVHRMIAVLLILIASPVAFVAGRLAPDPAGVGM